jgi:hypothetical protein
MQAERDYKPKYYVFHECSRHLPSESYPPSLTSASITLPSWLAGCSDTVEDEVEEVLGDTLDEETSGEDGLTAGWRGGAHRWACISASGFYLGVPERTWAHLKRLGFSSV